jgi:hypothetical protein
MNNFTDLSILNGETLEPNDGRVAPLDGSAASGGLTTSGSANASALGAAAARGPLGVDGGPAANAQDALAKQALGPNNERLEDLTGGGWQGLLRTLPCNLPSATCNLILRC